MGNRILVKCPLGYARVRKDGFIKRSYLVVQQLLGRSLLSGEVVHHINGNTKDDRPENLRVMAHGEHTTLHQLLRWGKPHNSKKICHNGHEFSLENTYLYISKNGRARRQCRECDRLRKQKYYAQGKYHYKKTV